MPPWPGDAGYSPGGGWAGGHPTWRLAGPGDAPGPLDAGRWCGAGRFYCGASMVGTFAPGDRLTVASVPLTAIARGDVVVYRRTGLGGGDECLLVHRIVAVAAGGLVARGDNNPRPDADRVTADNLVGRVTQAERGGRTRQVRGGRWGLLAGRLRHARLRARAWVRAVGRRPYRWFRATGLVARWWHPPIVCACFRTERETLVKYLSDGRTVACWWPEEGCFRCRWPYDLVLVAPGAVGRRQGGPVTIGEAPPS